MEISVIDTNFIKRNVLDSFNSLLWVDKFNEAGEFEIYTPPNTELLENIQNEYYLQIKESHKTMLVMTKGIKTDAEEGDRLIITGKSLEYILERRIIWGQKVLTGSLQDGVGELLSENIINPTDTNRRIDNFIFIPSTNPLITDLTIDAQYFGDNLYTVIVDICKAEDIGFEIILNDGVFEFRLYAGTDRSYEQVTRPHVTFSPEFDNLLSSDYVESNEPLKTVSLIAGEGQGSDRVISQVETKVETGLNRRETFITPTGISRWVDGAEIPEAEYVDQLNQKGKEELSNKKSLKSFDSEIEQTGSYQYGKDYKIGDIVQIVNEYGLEGRSRVTEFLMSQSARGFEAYPTFKKVD